MGEGSYSVRRIIKGTVSRDFSPPIISSYNFCIQQIRFRIFQILATIFDSSFTRQRRCHRRRSLADIAVRWIFKILNGCCYEVIYAFPLVFLLIVPLKPLASCQQSRWCIFGVSKTLALHAFTGVTDTGEACITDINDTSEITDHYWLLSMTPVMHASLVSLILVKCL